MKAAMDEYLYGMCDGQMFFRVGVMDKYILWMVQWTNIFMEGAMEFFLWKVQRKNIFMEGATGRAIATTTVTNGAAKPSSGETTRPLRISS